MSLDPLEGSATSQLTEKEQTMTAQSIPAPSWARGPIVDDEEVRYDTTVGTMPDHVRTVGLTRADVGPEPGETTVYAFDEVFTSAAGSRGRPHARPRG